MLSPLPPPPAGTASVIALREILDLASAFRIDTRAALATAGIAPETLADNSAWIPVPQFERALAAMVDLAENPAIALQMAQRAQPTTFGIVSYVAMIAPTMGEVIKRAIEYERLLGDFGSTNAEDVEDGVRITWHCHLADPRVRRLFTEGVLAAWAVYARFLVGDANLHPLRVLLMHDAPASRAHLAEYERVFHAPVQFGQPVNGIVVPRAFFDLKLRQGDPVLLHTVDTHVRQRLANVDTQVTVRARVRQAIADCVASTGLPRKERVAAMLEMNPRTLLRRLQDEGTTYQDVLDDVRREVAIELTRNSGLSQAEIAARLGFAEIRSLQRCFRRWTGMTFAEFRRDQPDETR